tara:strand:+ start:742 stop:891 length:150 start_codon:yes stop_codon:yes gene_type:complete
MAYKVEDISEIVQILRDVQVLINIQTKHEELAEKLHFRIENVLKKITKV